MELGLREKDTSAASSASGQMKGSKRCATCSDGGGKEENAEIERPALHRRRIQTHESAATGSKSKTSGDCRGQSRWASWVS